jgi:hypothetical protein
MQSSLLRQKPCKERCVLHLACVITRIKGKLNIFHWLADIQCVIDRTINEVHWSLFDKDREKLVSPCRANRIAEYCLQLMDECHGKTQRPIKSTQLLLGFCCILA